MDYDGLSHFIRKEMRMTHIYQPVMIRTLLEADGNRATAGDIARNIVSVDPILLEYYKGRVKVWPHKTPAKTQDSIPQEGRRYTALRLDRPLTRREKEKLAEMCVLRLQEFIDKDPAVKRMRALNDGPIPGSMRFDVLARIKGSLRRMWCKIVRGKAARGPHNTKKQETAGPYLRNLQALCGPCNTAKRDRDETDFLKWQKRLQFRHPKCALCSSSPAEPPINGQRDSKGHTHGSHKGRRQF